MCAEERANILQQKLEHQQIQLQRLKEQLKILQPHTPDVVLERDKGMLNFNFTFLFVFSTLACIL
jgi:hypothetical protein